MNSLKGAGIIALAVACLTACGPVRQADPEQEGGGTDGAVAAAADATPRRGGTLVTGVSTDPTGVNEYIRSSTAISQELYTFMFLRLVEEQPDYVDHPPTFEPVLAERWERSEDGKSITFYLRDDVVWSDGVPVTAEDIRFTWEAQTHPDVIWDSAFLKEPISDVEVVDRFTVRFHFDRVYANQLIDANEGAIIPKHAWSKLPFDRWRDNADWFRDNLVVSGPYILSQWRPQEELVFDRNERFYLEGLPYIDRLVVRVVPDRANLLAQALSRRLDFVNGLTREDVPLIERAPHLKLITFSGRGYAFLAWNTRRTYFAEPAVRRALTMAIDRQSMVEEIWGPYGTIATSPIVSDVWAHNETIEPLPFDPLAAQRILEEQGWRDEDGDGVREKDGVRFSFTLPSNDSNRQRYDAALMIQQQLGRVGVEVDVELTEFNTLMQQVDRGDYDAVMMKFAMPTDLDLAYAFHSKSIGVASNVFGYSNPEVDRLIEAADQVRELEEIEQFLNPIQELIYQDQPVTFLWESKTLAAANTRVRNIQPNLLRTYWHIWEWWLAEDR